MPAPFLLPRPDRRPGIGWLPITILAIAHAGGIVALVVAITSLVAYCASDAPSAGCPSGSPGPYLVGQAVLAPVGIGLLLAVGSALRRDRARVALTMASLVPATYLAWGLMLDAGAHGDLTIF